MSYKRISPMPVVEGGSGAQTLTGVLTGNGTSAFTANAVTQYYTLVAGASNAVGAIAPSATSGIPYISQGSASNPTFGTAVVAGGGTGQTTLTNHGVLVGAGTSAISQTAVGATNTVLLGNTGADPSFGQVPNGALVNNSITLSNGNNITITGSPVALGGTATINVSGTTNNSLLLGNSTGSIASLGVATNGQIPIGSTGTTPVLATITAGANITVTNGAGAITIAASSGGISTINGDSGSVTGSTVTVSGGSTGLTTSCSGTTLSLTGTLAIANGGTNATSMSTSTGIVKYDGTRLVTSSTAKIDSSNRTTNSSQPAFNAYNSNSPANVTGDGTTYKVAFDTTIFDQASNFNTSTYTFTAPIAGKYQFNATIGGYNLGAGHTIGLFQLVTTAQTYGAGYGNWATGGGAASNGVKLESASWIVTMSANDTAYVQFGVYNSTKTVGLEGGAGNASFSGYLVC